jgi:type IV secretory pathway TraG/TraD family ATPase VirD4
MTAQEIKQLPDDKVIVFHKNYWPFITKRMDYRRFPTLVNRKEIPPPVLPVLSDIPVRESSSTGNGLARPIPLFLHPTQK